MKWIVVGVGTSPDAGSLGELVAMDTLRTAMPENTRILIRNKICREDKMGFECHIHVYMVAVTGFTNFPGSTSHEYLQKYLPVGLTIIYLSWNPDEDVEVRDSIIDFERTKIILAD